MLKVIKRVLRLSGDLSKRIYASFVFSFIDSIVAMFPVGAVFYTLTKIQNNKASVLLAAVPECRGLRQNRRSRARRTASAWRGGLCSR